MEERQTALTQIYYQVLERQPYAYERKLLAQAEKDFLRDKIGVRRFLKELGNSEVYLNAFYHKSSNLKFLELCFKHFMGRAWANEDEMKQYCNILMTCGVSGLITTILDSEEYRKVFGCFTVPYARKKTYYPSPKAYLQTETLNHEHFGQRGWIVPTMIWHHLGLNCDAGVCRHPEADEVLIPPPSEEIDRLEQELIAMFKNADPTQARGMLSSLSPAQRRMLRQAIR
jgi:hypothetical protein